jgi:hypothetical protein
MASVRHLGLFPFCIIDANKRKTDGGNQIPLGEGTLYPLQIPIEEAMSWYWKVKQWKVTASITFKPSPEDLPQTISDEKFVISHAQTFGTLPPANIPLNEKYLVCEEETSLDVGGNLDAIQFYLFSLTVAPVGTNDPFFVERMFYNDNGWPPKNVWPALFVYISYLGGLSVESINPNISSIKSGGKITIKASNNTYTIASFVPDSAEFIDGEIEIEAIEYWPYDPGDGLGPIYDSTTGAQLRPFPST